MEAARRLAEWVFEHEIQLMGQSSLIPGDATEDAMEHWWRKQEIPALEWRFWERPFVEFGYLAQWMGRHSHQRVQPYGVLYGNRAFLVGQTDWANDTRLWRLANMSDARIIDETFERDPIFDLRSYAKRSFGTFQEEPGEVALRFDLSVVSDVTAFLFHPDQTVSENDDGSLTVRFTAGGLNEMYWHLFTWGDSVTVEQPSVLRQRLAQMCSALATHHAV